jgi:hypothetical protein
MRIQAFAMGFCLAWATVEVARADDVTITIIGAHKSTTFDFALNSANPTPDLWVPGVEFNVSATVDGSPTTFASLTFVSKDSGGGFAVDDSFNFVNTFQLYSGSEESPIFITEVYKGLVSSNGKSYTVKVTDVASEPPTTVGDPPLGVGSDHPHPPIMGSDPPDPRPVATPELSTWAMLLLGFLGMGYAGYRKARTGTIS